MANRLPPIVGHWFTHRDKGELFHIVALDEASGTVELQEFDGGLDEVDIEEWRAMSIERAAPPEDWSGPMGDIDADELGYTDYIDELATPDPLDEAAMTWSDVVADDDLDEFPVQRATLRRLNRRDH